MIFKSAFEFVRSRMPVKRRDLEKLRKEIEMKLTELATQLTALADQTEKIKAEVQALKDSLSNVDLPAEATDALARLSALISDVDAINPDEPAPEGNTDPIA